LCVCVIVIIVNIYTEYGIISIISLVGRAGNLLVAVIKKIVFFTEFFFTLIQKHPVKNLSIYSIDIHKLS